MADNQPHEIEDFEKKFTVKTPQLSTDPSTYEPTAEDTWAFGEYLYDRAQGVNWSRQILWGGTDTAFWRGLSQDDRLGMGIGEASQFFDELLGSDVAPWLQASMIPDAQEREDYFARLRALASGVPQESSVVGQFGVPGRGGQKEINPETGQPFPDVGTDWTQEISSNQLTHRLAAMVAFLADRTDRWEGGVAVSSYNYDQVLTPNQIAQVQGAVRSGSEDRGLIAEAIAQATPTAAGGSFEGSFLKTEQGSNTYELNEEWAKAHPTRALAVTKMVQDLHPGAEVRIGGQGFVHPVFQMLGKPIDYVSSPLAIGYKYLARGAGELGEQALLGSNRDQFNATADQLEEDLRNGVVPPEDVDDVIRDIERFRDWGTAGNYLNEGESIGQDIQTAFNPENSGLGLALLSAEGIGLYPGDPAYAPWVAGVGLIHNFSPADPLMWRGMYKQAKNLAEAATIKGLTVSGREAATASGLETALGAGKTSLSYLKDKNFVMLGTNVADASTEVNAARHAAALKQARQFAKKKGYDVVETTMADGKNGILILGMTGEEGLNFARSLKQESFRTADGIIHADRSITPFDISKADDSVKFLDEGVDGLHLEGRFAPIKFDVPDPNARVFTPPPKVSGNWIVQRMFQKFAKTPDELMYTDNAIAASDAIFDTVRRIRDIAIAEARVAGITDPVELARIGADSAVGLLAQWSPNYDPAIIRALAEAGSKADVHNVLTMSILGGVRDPLYYDKLINRMADSGSELGKIDAKLEEFEELSRQLSDYALSRGVTPNLDEAGATILRGLYHSDEEFRQIVKRWRELQSSVKGLDARRIDLIADRMHLRSVLDMDEITMPMRQIPSDKMLKQLRSFSPTEQTKLEKFMVALSNYPGQTTTRGLVQAARGSANVEKRAKEIFFRFGHLKQMMSGGREIKMPLPGHALEEGQLVDYVSRSLNTVRDHAKLFGLGDRDVQSLLAAYLRIGNREDWYMFIRKLYEDIANKSPLLDANGRRILRETHADLVSERGGSFLQKQDDMGFLERSHTLSREIIDPLTGQKIMSGMPAFSGDFLNTVRIPSNEILMEHLSVVRRWQKALYAKGGVAKIGAEAIMGARDVLNASTYIWKSAVLIGRMPFALLSRIQGEQAWRMASLDYASSVRDPLEWLRAVLVKGDYKMFKDTHDEFLGTLADNYNEVHSFGSSVRVFRRGNTTLQPGDGDRFWNALSMLFLRRYRSSEINILLADEDVATIIRNLENDPVGRGILDNFDRSGFSREESIIRMKEELALISGGRADLYDVLRRGAHVDETPESVELARLIDSRPRHDNDMTIDGQPAGFDQFAGEPRLLANLEQWAKGEVDLAALNLRRTRVSKNMYKVEDLDSGSVHYIRLGDDGKLVGYRTVDVQGEGAVYVIPEMRGKGASDDLFDMLAEDRGWNSLEDMTAYINKQMFSAEGAGSMKKQARRYAQKRGWIDKDSSLKVGTREYGQWLKQEYEAGRFTPPQFVGAKEAEYVIGDSTNLAGRFRDFMFEQFYQRPDVYLSRGPMFRQAALREYNRLTNLGWSEKRAKAAAEAWGAEQTSNWMYNLAARTSAQYFMRNMLPFFPAWQELGRVWLLQLPARAGGGGFGGWAVGTGLYAHRADALGDFFKATGLVYDDPVNDELVFKIPGLDKAFAWLTGDETAQLRFRVSGITGMLPIPGEDSFVPGLGPAPSSLLGLMARHNDVIYSLANHVLRYGNEVQVGPTSINHIFHAAGVVPPWEMMTRDTRDLMMTLSLEDAIRSVYDEMPPAPRIQDYKSEEKYAEAAKQWSEELLNRAEQRSSVHYLTRALAGMVSPTSPSITNEYTQEMQRIWQFVSAYEDATGGEVASPLVDSFKRKYPGAVWYSNSKVINHGPERDSDDFDDFIKAYREGQIQVMTPEQFIEWNLGMTQYWVMLNSNRNVTKNMSASDILTHGFERKDARSDNYREWQMYIDTHPVFAKLFDDWQSTLDDEDQISMTLQQQYVLDAKRQLESLDKLFTVNGIRDADYRKVLGVLSSQINYAATKTDDPVWNTVNRWWEEVGAPGYEAMAELYDRAFALPKPEQGPVFEQLRQLKNSWENVTYGGAEMPTPEEVTWGNKNSKEQDIKRLEWVGSPIEWLSKFERSKVGYGGDDRVDGLMSWINQKDSELSQWAADNYISTSSREYEDRKTAGELEIAQWAAENGLGEFWTWRNEPTYQKVLQLDLYGRNKTYEYISTLTDNAWLTVRSAGYEPGGSSEIARRTQVWLFTKIDQARMADPGFDTLMKQMEVAYAPTGRDQAVGYEMYYKVFFAYFGPTPTISYTSPYSMTGGQ